MRFLHAAGEAVAVVAVELVCLVSVVFSILSDPPVAKKLIESSQFAFRFNESYAFDSDAIKKRG